MAVRIKRLDLAMIGKAGELVLPRRALKQPNPGIHAGGDCGACALGGALDMTVPEVYDAFNSKGITNGCEMARCLRCASHFGKADRVLYTHAEWDYRTGCDAFGHPGYFAYLTWFNYIRMGVDAGYYAVAMVNFERNAEPETNHWILICGARTEGSVIGKTITGEVLVSCSVRGEEWHEARYFLRNMGGYDSLLVRPAA